MAFPVARALIFGLGRPDVVSGMVWGGCFIGLNCAVS
jgi:hypothetical protein